MYRENLDSIENWNIELVRYKVDDRIREHLDGTMRIVQIEGKWIGTVEREIRVEGEIAGLPRIRDKYREKSIRPHYRGSEETEHGSELVKHINWFTLDVCSMESLGHYMDKLSNIQK